jgi:Na+-transporting methylmalonyl-CoA/oxaloacetate decarboxylase gamma subunit
MNEELLDLAKGFLAVFVLLIVLVSVLWGMFAVSSVYSVWSQSKAGEAEPILEAKR